jgi:predicted 3-demethylubiquinone-9 3-methyltransferase (glyoxalase superfamily)
MCGWLKDRFGVPRQVVPAHFEKLLSTGDPVAGRTCQAGIVPMKKIIIADLESAAAAG